MSTILKTFRLPKDCVEFLEKESIEKDISQSKMVADFIKNLMDFEAQWQRDLLRMTQDEEYRKEQLEMAEENYD